MTSPQPERQPELLTLAVTARLMAVHPNTLRRIFKDGDLRRVNIGTAKSPTWRVDKDELRRYIAERTERAKERTS